MYIPRTSAAWITPCNLSTPLTHPVVRHSEQTARHAPADMTQSELAVTPMMNDAANVAVLITTSLLHAIC
jgi:hypothetical protein